MRGAARIFGCCRFRSPQSGRIWAEQPRRRAEQRAQKQDGSPGAEGATIHTLEHTARGKLIDGGAVEQDRTARLLRPVRDFPTAANWL